MNKRWTNAEQTMYEQWRNYERTMNEQWTNDKQMLNEIWTNNERTWNERWTNDERMINERKEKKNQACWLFIYCNRRLYRNNRIFNTFFNVCTLTQIFFFISNSYIFLSDWVIYLENCWRFYCIINLKEKRGGAFRILLFQLCIFDLIHIIKVV